VTSVTLGSFDASPLNSVLDQVIPCITVAVDATKLNNGLETLVVERGGKTRLNGSDLLIQLRCDKFDVELRKALGFDKVRLKNLDPEKLEAIQNLSPSIQLIPDTNFAKNAYLCLYPSELGEKIKAINTAKSTPAAQNAPNVEQGKWTSSVQNKTDTYLSK
jgi:hypothetical protein